jgi:hypothetical protein
VLTPPNEDGEVALAGMVSASLRKGVFQIRYAGFSGISRMRSELDTNNDLGCRGVTTTLGGCQLPPPGQDPGEPCIPEPPAARCES